MSSLRVDSSRSELVFAITYAGAIGSAAVASFFLVLDTIAGRPLDTPILLGSALFLGEIGAATSSLRLDLAAAYSLLHLAIFFTVGGVFALVAQRLREMPGLPAVLLAGIFLTLHAGLVALDALVPPELVAAIGLTSVLAGNLLASGAMTAFYLQALEIRKVAVKVPTTLIGDSD